MSSLTYSPGALSTLPKFHRKRFVLYVEGDDDVLFWGILFKRFGVTDLHVKIAGGSSELDKYIRSIVNDNAAIVVARDRDYTEFKKTHVKHPRVLYTYGYSIENSIYCPGNLSRAIAIYSKSLNTFEKDVTKWASSFVKGFETLLILDLANELSGKGVQVLGQSCGRFLVSNGSHDANAATVQTFAGTVRKQLKPKEIYTARRALKDSSRDLFYIFRGHFLSLAVLNFVKNMALRESGKRPAMSYESLHAFLISNFETACSSGRDLTFVKRQITRLKRKGTSKT